MATNISREERRKKIMERGSDRLALITGKLKDLPVSPPPSPSASTPQHPMRTLSFPSQPSSFQPPHHHHRHSDSQPTLPHRLHVCSHSNDDDSLAPSSPALLEITQEVSKKIDDFDLTKHNIVSQVPSKNSKSTTDSVQTDTKEKRNQDEEQRSSNSSIVRNSQIDKEPNLSRRLKPTIFSYKRLNDCIIATQSTRIISSLLIAILVVFSFVGCSECVIATRPLHILLITDITIVLAKLYFDKTRGFEELEEEQEEEAMDDDQENWGSAFKLLEKGLTLYQVVRGIFIDFSVYAVVVICALSLQF